MNLSLDTNAYSKFASGHKPLLEALEYADEIYLSTIALGELFAGFSLGSRYERNLSVLKEFIDMQVTDITEITRDVAERYAMIYTGLRSRGTPIPTNDIWIAAAAFETGTRLVTYDVHFSAIPGLMLIAP